MQNPFCYGVNPNTNYSAFLFIVTTPGKLTGWIGHSTESTNSFIIALTQWLSDIELLGGIQSVQFIRTINAAAPEHQEMNSI
jgi:hypothetical protein